jgi:RNA polymerase sigma factor (sigma-70 family)
MVKETDEELVNMIKSGGPAREKALHRIYTDSNIREKIIAMIANNNGNQQDGEDMVQEAIIVMDKNIREGRYRTEGNLQSYLFAIGKYLWMNQLRKKKPMLKGSFTDLEVAGDPDKPDHFLLDEERKMKLQALLSRLGKRCHEILSLWQLSFSMEEIAVRMKLNDASTARKAKYDCQQQLIKLIQNSSLTKSDLT